MGSSTLYILLCIKIFVLVVFVINLNFRYKETQSLSDLDSSVDPCDDFYQFACGQWLSDNPLPAEYSKYSRSFTVVNSLNEERVKEIITTKAKKSVLYDFYNLCVENDDYKLSVEEIVSLFEEIDVSLELFDIERSFFEVMHLNGFSAFFSISSEIDRFNPSDVIFTISNNNVFQLPKSFYSKPEVRRDYELHIKKLFDIFFVESGRTYELDPLQISKDVFEVESFLAINSMEPTEERDPYATYNDVSEEEFGEYPLEFEFLFDGTYLGRQYNGVVNIASLDYFRKVSEFINDLNVPIEKLKNYLKWIVLHELAKYSTKKIVLEDFSFFGKYINGQEEQKKREIKCVELTNENFGFLVGEYFVKDYFSEGSKISVENMLATLISTISENIPEILWMDVETQEKAKIKLSKMTHMIGYPDDFTPFTSILPKEIASDVSMVSIVIDVRNSLKMFDFKQVGLAVDKSIWYMYPQEVNAYFEPTMNEMAYPAGILQFPFYHSELPISMNFGGIGVVQGHEIFHSFDDEGSKYNGDGRLEDWWSEETKKKWKKKVECIQNQYSEFSPIDNYYVNGNLTSGENIADNAGLKYSYLTYRKSKGEEYGKEKSTFLGEYTNDQLFFIAFAQVWCANSSRENIIQRILQDPHSPPQFRVIGTVMNSIEFSDTFQCDSGKNMNPEDKCSLF